MIKEIVEAVSIPIMAKVRIGHFVEAQVSDMTTRTHTRHLPLGKTKSLTHITLSPGRPRRRYYKALVLTTSTSRKC